MRRYKLQTTSSTCANHGSHKNMGRVERCTWLRPAGKPRRSFALLHSPQVAWDKQQLWTRARSVLVSGSNVGLFSPINNLYLCQ